jgi:D-3-phosphoglycerate dehydrogenase / 2-oxoglutarate reductase
MPIKSLNEGMTRKKVLLTEPMAPQATEFLTSKGYEVIQGTGKPDDVLAKIADAEGALVRTFVITADVLKAAPKLRVLAKHGVGVDNFDVPTATELGIQIVNAPLSNSNAVAEHTIGAILAVAKHFIWSDQETRKGNWAFRNQRHTTDLEGKTLGILGLGRIGTAVGKKAALGLDMTVIGYDPFVDSSKLPKEIQRLNTLEEVIRRADFLTIHMPLTKDTKGLLGEKELSLLKPGVYFINAARGELVDEKCLIRLLKEAKIAGAALDVFEEEPLPKDHPLYAFPNVLLTPHNSALTHGAIIRMATDAAKGIDEVLSGKAPTWPVNKLASVRA